jgi:hypothetical protein
LETREANVRLKEEVTALKSLLADSASIVWDEPYFFRTTDGKKDGPFCQVCRDNSDKFVRLEKNKSREPSCEYRCLVCKNAFNGTKHAFW